MYCCCIYCILLYCIYIGTYCAPLELDHLNKRFGRCCHSSRPFRKSGRGERRSHRADRSEVTEQAPCFDPKSAPTKKRETPNCDILASWKRLKSELRGFFVILRVDDGQLPVGLNELEEASECLADECGGFADAGVSFRASGFQPDAFLWRSFVIYEPVR